MPIYRATLHGSGKAEIAAYGVGDAEARLEKELAHIVPGAELRVRGISRADEVSRIVESFVVSYQLRLSIELEARDEPAARKAAFAAGRRMLEGSRFRRVAWERAEVRD